MAKKAVSKNASASSASGSNALISEKAAGGGEEEEDSGEEVDEEEEMRRLLGFGDFDSTKGKPVDDNFETAAAGAAAKHKKRVYRYFHTANTIFMRR